MCILKESKKKMYPQKENGDQYYDTKSYRTDSNGNEIYARLKNNCQIYLTDEFGFDIMAKRKNAEQKVVPYFAFDEEDHPICPRLEKNMMYLELDISYPQKLNLELYPKLNDKEYYIGQNDKCRYALSQLGYQYYARIKNKKYYAFEKNAAKDFIEFPIIAERGKKKYIIEDSNYIYPFNITKLKPLYPKDQYLNEIYLKLNNNECFAIKNNIPFYAKTKDGHDILPYDTKNEKYYIFSMSDNNKKIEFYPKKGKNDYYLVKDKCEIYAKKLDDEFYARNEKNNDGVNKADMQFYSSTRNKDNTEENFYPKEGKREVIAKNLKTGQGYYARTFKEKEIYPKSFEVEKEKSKPKTTVRKNYNFIGPSLTDIIEHKASIK